MTATLHTNGRARKSLAEQIDRLDSVLDGLADNLNEAVAMAVQEAVGTAVRETISVVLKELLSQPTFLAALKEKLAPPAPTPAPFRLTGLIVSAAVLTLRLLQRGCQAVVNVCLWSVVSFSPDGRCIAGGYRDGGLWLWRSEGQR